VHELAGAVLDDSETELAVFANSRRGHEHSLHSDTRTNTTVLSVGLGPDRPDPVRLAELPSNDEAARRGAVRGQIAY